MVRQPLARHNCTNELAWESETDHRHAHAKFKARLPQPLQRNCRNRAELAARDSTFGAPAPPGCGVRRCIPVGGNGLANTGDAIADAKLVNLTTDRGDDSRAAVTQGHRRAQALLNLPHCGDKTLLLERLDNLFDLVRPLAGLSGKIHSRLNHLHFLGAHADE